MSTFIPYANPAAAAGTIGQNQSLAPYNNSYVSNDANLANIANTNPSYSGAAANQQAVNDSGASYAAQQAAAQQAAQKAAYISQLQGQLGQLDPQQQIGLQNLSDSFNQGANRLDQQLAVSKRDYGTGVQRNTQSYLNNRNGIMSRTATNSNALQTLLGINGSGNSSAAYFQAPYAAALQGSTDLNQAQQTYGNNQSALDTNWQDTQRGYSNSLQDLKSQRYQQENALKSSIAQTRASILGQIGNAGSDPSQYNDQINTLLGQITQLGKQYANPVLRAKDVSFAAPNMSDWYLNSHQGQAGQQAQAAGGAAADVNPTFLGLLGQQRDQYGNLINA